MDLPWNDNNGLQLQAAMMTRVHEITITKPPRLETPTATTTTDD